MGHTYIARLSFLFVLLVIILPVFLSSSSAIPQRIPVTVSYTPPASAFALHNNYQVIYSAYAWEASLLDYHSPVADIDYMLPYGSSQLISLPGDISDQYYYYGAVYIDGSGWVEKWATPNGGRFAFLHMRSLWVKTEPGVIPYPRFPLPTPQTCVHFPCTFDVGDNNTAFVAQYLFRHQPRTVNTGYYRGGQLVGYNGWPTSAIYGNGTSGPLNAHLCLLLDQTADAWFSYVLHRPAFRHKLWNRYRDVHHLARISEYWQGSFSWQASIWRYHQTRCGGVVSKDTYHAAGYSSMRFEGCTIYTWPRYHTSRVV